MDDNFASSAMHVSFKILIEVRKLVRSSGKGLQRRGDRIYWYKGLKGNNGTRTGVLNLGGREEYKVMERFWEGINKSKDL